MQFSQTVTSLFPDVFFFSIFFYGNGERDPSLLLTRSGRCPQIPSDDCCSVQKRPFFFSSG